jgi:general secretion pathway protein A
MYRTHFGLTCHPFAKELPTDELFVSAAAKELEARIAHLIDLRGLGLVTGDPGSGKTAICRKVAANLHTGLYRVFYIPNSTGNVLDTYKAICWEFGLAIERSRAALYRAIRGEVTRLCLESRMRPILIVDEAHHLRSDVLEDLRLLTNYEMDSKNRLCLLLVGQTELRRRIGMAVHEALSQRIVVRQQVTGLQHDELEPYIKHLLARAGAAVPLFEPAALHTIYQASGGLPRKVNQLAHHALLAASLAHAKIANAEHAQAAVQEVA